MKLFRVLAAVGALLGMSACSGEVVAPEQPRMEISGPATVYRGTTAQFTATLAGGRGSGAVSAVQWSSTDTLIASVDSTGLVRGRSPGSVQLSASVGSLSHSVSVSVEEDRTLPSITELSFAPAAVHLGEGDVRMTFTVRAVDAQSGIGSVHVILSQPGSPRGSHPLHACLAESPVSGTPRLGVWQCEVVLNRHVPPGTWKASAILTDRARNRSEPHPWIDFPVAGSLPDATAPVLRSLSINPDSVSVRTQAARLGIHVSATDAESGVSAVKIFYRFSTGGSGMISMALPASGSVHEGVWSWTPLATQGSSTRTLSITRIEMPDFRGNVVTFTAEQLRALGFATEVKIIG